MLYKDDQRIDLTKEQKSELKKRFKFPVVVKYDKKYITWDKVNKRDVYPPSISVPANGSIVSKEGDVNSFRYAKRASKIEGEVQYTPSAIVVNKQLVLNEVDIDLLGYLFFYCPFMTNGKLSEEAKRKGRTIHHLNIASSVKILISSHYRIFFTTEIGIIFYLLLFQLNIM